MAARRDFTRESLADGVRAGDRLAGRPRFRGGDRAVRLLGKTENAQPFAYDFLRIGLARVNRGEGGELATAW